MTRNPYAQMDNPHDSGRAGAYGGGDFINDAPPRTSALAVASLIVSIVSLIACCVPGPDVLGMLLAVGAVISISKSQGRRTGMGMAIAGLVIGLISTIITVLFWVGASMMAAEFTSHRTTLDAVWQRDLPATTAAFDPAVSASITPERIETFIQEVENELGAYKGMPNGLLDLWTGYSQIGPALQAANQQTYGGQFVPIPTEFDNGYAAVMLELAPNTPPAPGAFLPPLRNVGVLLPRAQRIVWLLDLLPAAPGVPTIPTLPPIPPSVPTPDDDDPTEPTNPEGDPQPAPPTAPPTDPDR